MQKLTKQNFNIVSPLLSQLETHTVINTILSGEVPGKVYCDHPKEPEIAFTQFRHRAFFAGDPSKSDPEAIKEFIESAVFENCRNWDVPLIRLAAEPLSWINHLERILESRQPITAIYQIYQYQISDRLPEVDTPDGYRLQQVISSLIDEDFDGKDDLLEEMCSERESVESFLMNSFGIAAFKDQTLAGWCLSEYNWHNRCEVGIATMLPFQRQGLAKSMSRAFIRLAAGKGIDTILWHCYRSNEPSWRTALSAGFSLLKEEPVLMLYLDPALNAAVHGNLNFEREDYQQALMWYQKALSEDEPQSWMAWNGCCAAAHDGQIDLAFDLLHQAIDLGFADLDYLVQSQHLTPLKDDER